MPYLRDGPVVRFTKPPVSKTLDELYYECVLEEPEILNYSAFKVEGLGDLRITIDPGKIAFDKVAKFSFPRTVTSIQGYKNGVCLMTKTPDGENACRIAKAEVMKFLESMRNQPALSEEEEEAILQEMLKTDVMSGRTNTYGEDLPIALSEFLPGLPQLLQVAKLKDPMRRCYEKMHAVIDGVTTVFGYMASKGSMSFLHNEDFALSSVSVSYHGSAAKVWIIFRTEDYAKVRQFLKMNVPSPCSSPEYHKEYALSGDALDALGCGYKLVQRGGDIVFTNANGLHQVMNIGPSFMEATNIWTRGVLPAVSRLNLCSCEHRQAWHAGTDWNFLDFVLTYLEAQVFHAVLLPSSKSTKRGVAVHARGSSKGSRCGGAKRAAVGSESTCKALPAGHHADSDHLHADDGSANVQHCEDEVNDDVCMPSDGAALFECNGDSAVLVADSGSGSDACEFNGFADDCMLSVDTNDVEKEAAESFADGGPLNVVSSNVVVMAEGVNMVESAEMSIVSPSGIRDPQDPPTSVASEMVQKQAKRVAVVHPMPMVIEDAGKSLQNDNDGVLQQLPQSSLRRRPVKGGVTGESTDVFVPMPACIVNDVFPTQTIQRKDACSVGDLVEKTFERLLEETRLKGKPKNDRTAAERQLKFNRIHGIKRKRDCDIVSNFFKRKIESINRTQRNVLKRINISCPRQPYFQRCSEKNLKDLADIKLARALIGAFVRYVHGDRALVVNRLGHGYTGKGLIADFVNYRCKPNRDFFAFCMQKAKVDPQFIQHVMSSEENFDRAFKVDREGRIPAEHAINFVENVQEMNL